MRRAIKFICAVGFYTLALLPGGFAFVLFSHNGVSDDPLAFFIATIFSALALGLVWAGSYLLARLDLPVARTAKALIGGLIFCFILAIAIAAPNFRPRATSSCNGCINNLRQIDAAANQFALVNHLNNGDRINFPNDLTPYIKLNAEGKIPPCPAGGIYHVGRVGNAPTCTLGTTVVPAHVLP